jgi:hypothetical protein
MHEHLEDLAGRVLVCTCPVDELPCHADELARRAAERGGYAERAQLVAWIATHYKTVVSIDETEPMCPAVIYLKTPVGVATFAVKGSFGSPGQQDVTVTGQTVDRARAGQVVADQLVHVGVDPLPVHHARLADGQAAWAVAVEPAGVPAYRQRAGGRLGVGLAVEQDLLDRERVSAPAAAVDDDRTHR